MAAARADIRRALEYDADDVFQAAKKAIGQSRKFTIKKIDDKAYTIWASAKISVRSWGESILLSVLPLQRGSEISIYSQSKYGVIDWGKNQDNIAALLNMILLQLDQKEPNKEAGVLYERMNVGIYACEERPLQKTELSCIPNFFSKCEMLDEFPELDANGYAVSSNACSNIYGVSKSYDGYPAQRAIERLKDNEKLLLNVENDEVWVYTQNGKKLGTTQLSKKSDEILRSGGTVLSRVEQIGINEVGIRWVSIRTASYGKIPKAKKEAMKKSTKKEQ